MAVTVPGRVPGADLPLAGARALLPVRALIHVQILVHALAPHAKLNSGDREVLRDLQ